MEHQAISTRTPPPVGLSSARRVEDDRDVEEQRLVVVAAEDAEAFATLYRKYVRRVYRYFWHYVGRAVDAEDLTSVTFSKALISIGRYEGRGGFAEWLFAIARHTLYDFQRRQRPQMDIAAVASLLEDSGIQPEARFLETERATTLYRLVRQLPKDQREALVLRFFGDLSSREVAGVLNRSEAAVKMLVHRAVVTLRTHYNKEAQE